MAQAMQVPMNGGGLPAGTALVQPSMAGEANLPEMVVKIGADRHREYEEKLGMIAQRLETLAGEQVTAKSQVEQRWLEGVRAFHGYYDDSTEKTLRDAKQSRAFVKATRSKTVALEARLFDLIFPTDDRNWGIEATAVPKMSKEGMDAAKQAAAAAEQANMAEQAGDQQGAQQALAQGNDQGARHLVANSVIEASR